MGKRVAIAAAAELNLVQLELGGNDAAIILPSADITETVTQLVDSAFRRSGQFCYATKRVYVHTSIKERMIEALVASADKLKMGPPSDSLATLGPVIDRTRSATADRTDRDGRRPPGQPSVLVGPFWSLCRPR